MTISSSAGFSRSILANLLLITIGPVGEIKVVMPFQKGL